MHTDMQTTPTKQRMPLITAFLERNSKINLSAIRETEWVRIKHICDSIIWAQQVESLFSGWDHSSKENSSQENVSQKRPSQGISSQKSQSQKLPSDPQSSHHTTLLDVWTGWWFPLLPLAQHYPHLDCTGIDWRKKKIKAVNAIAKTIGLKNCNALWWRVEDHKKQYDIVTARAVAYSDTLLPWILPRVKPGGSIVLWKQFTFQEDADIHELMHDLGHNFKHLSLDSYRYDLPWEKSQNGARNHERIIYHIKKNL